MQNIIEKLYEKMAEKHPEVTTQMLNFAVQYLKRFNYINGDELTESVVQKATEDFQDSFGIEVDGNLNPQTVKAMTYPRCGCIDREHLIEGATDSRKWGLKHLRWCVVDYLPNMSKEEYLQIIQTVFNHLSTIIDVTFEQITDPNIANFLFHVSTSRRDELGVESGVLAFCELPPSSNYKSVINLTMDGAERWLPLGVRGKGIKTKNVFYHELLHGMGLQHSTIKTALMAAFYDPDVDQPVSPDDRERLINLYGPAKIAPIPPVEPPKPESNVTTIKVYGKVEQIEIPGYRLTKLAS